MVSFSHTEVSALFIFVFIYVALRHKPCLFDRALKMRSCVPGM